MAKKEFFCIVDVETTKTEKVFDFGALVVDRKGNIHKQCAVIVSDFINEELFYSVGLNGWSFQNAVKKKEAYNKMLADGFRISASVAAINRWLDKVIGQFNPMLTAYNLNFDLGMCQQSGINLNDFSNRFCLWHTAVNVFGNSKNFKAFALENHYFGNRTAKGNMTIKTNAEVMAHFVSGHFKAEPHTAIEDARDFELPILKAVVNKKGWKEKTAKPYNWQNHVLRDNFKPA